MLFASMFSVSSSFLSPRLRAVGGSHVRHATKIRIVWFPDGFDHAFFAKDQYVCFVYPY